MEGSDLLFKKNYGKGYKIHYKNAQAYININTPTVDDKVICKLIESINRVMRGITVNIVFKDMCFYDKLTYVLLECIIYQYGKKNKINVYYDSINDQQILTCGVKDSTILIDRRNQNGIQQIKTQFNSRIYLAHYRRVLVYNGDFTSDELSVQFTNIYNFLKGFVISDICRREIAEAVVELIGNANEHSRSDCLVDIDVAKDYGKKDSDELYYGINIVVLNFSNILLGDGIKRRIETQNITSERYKIVSEAYNKHTGWFNEKYEETDFYNITSFQKGISGRLDKTESGGRGLAILINSLAAMSDSTMCYVMSGNNLLGFRQGFLTYDKDNWIGFNEACDYVHSRPNLGLIGRSNTYMPGTAYNLNFIIKKECKKP